MFENRGRPVSFHSGLSTFPCTIPHHSAPFPSFVARFPESAIQHSPACDFAQNRCCTNGASMSHFVASAMQDGAGRVKMSFTSRPKSILPVSHREIICQKLAQRTPRLRDIEKRVQEIRFSGLPSASSVPRRSLKRKHMGRRADSMLTQNSISLVYLKTGYPGCR